MSHYVVNIGSYHTFFKTIVCTGVIIQRTICLLMVILQMGHVTQTTIEQQARVLAEHEKHRKAFILAQDIAQKLSTTGMNDFEEGMGDLKFLDEMWSKGKRVRILEMEKETGLITIDVCNKFINCA